MGTQEIVRIDGLKWWMTQTAAGGRVPVPLCPEHDLRLTPILGRIYSSYYHQYVDDSSDNSVSLECAEGPHTLKMPRKYVAEKKYVIDRIDAKIFKGMKTINLDDEAVPIAKEKVKSEDGKFFITTQLMESKRGLQAVIYAGKKGKTQKTQIFVEPEVKRLAFDQKDLHPTDVFLKVEATFDDGTKQSIEKYRRWHGISISEGRAYGNKVLLSSNALQYPQRSNR